MTTRWNGEGCCQAAYDSDGHAHAATCRTVRTDPDDMQSTTSDGGAGPLGTATPDDVAGWTGETGWDTPSDAAW